MRTGLFYLLLCLPIVVWALIVLPVYASSLPDWSSNLVAALVAASPIIGGDVSIFGELTPMILAGLIIGIAPASKDINYFAVVLAVLSYALFIHLSVFFSSGPGVGVMSANWDDTALPQKIALGFVSNVRVMLIVIAASLVGFKIRGA
jgi:hypothetical protein